ncbi:methylated-DNA--[protein]-cysteine S-methyltransferase [Catenulispora rubra]|uniref:methylated-DNA--[protein]-cysteine S-methyltransferase n=1 Tax=Catenulispora rubra TaxID=280293 RepID=UPI0018924297|nr:methylated-DNA--[protein]-cysteine S-methyltransferase [Catenulispora rubra]
MQTASLDTPIGTLTIGTTTRGLRVVQFPIDRGQSPSPRAIEEEEEEKAKSVKDAKDDRIAQAQLDEAVLQLTQYFDGTRTHFDIALDWYGVNGLRLTVLKLLAEVPFGETVTYGDLAKGSGAGVTASQAVGGIMGSNPLPIVVPCHRVLAADGLGGFGGGLRTKEWLLAWEGVMPPALDWGM